MKAFGRWAGFVAGPLAGLLVLWVPAAMPAAAQRVAALAAWMAVWWLVGAIPLAATSLLPLVVLPLTGRGAVDDVARRYADPIIFLFMGGFFLAAASERWGLHRRLALAVIAFVGAEASRLVLAIMVATAFVSMWISNTATAAMMLPITVALIELARREAPERAAAFGTALILGMAYSASIGGVATLIGTPPTAIFAAAAKTMIGRPVGFAEWLVVGLPIAALMLGFCWGAARASPLSGAGIAGRSGGVAGARTPGARELEPGPEGDGWGPRGHGTGVGLPRAEGGRRLHAPRAHGSRPVALRRRHRHHGRPTALYGAGLARRTPVRARLGDGGADPVGCAAPVRRGPRARGCEMAMPLVAALAPALGAPPLALMAAAALGSSLGFMLPVGTPPNALAFGTGAVSAKQMAKAGFWLDLAGVVVITLVVTIWDG